MHRGATKHKIIFCLSCFSVELVSCGPCSIKQNLIFGPRPSSSSFNFNFSKLWKFVWTFLLFFYIFKEWYTLNDYDNVRLKCQWQNLRVNLILLITAEEQQMLKYLKEIESVKSRKINIFSTCLLKSNISLFFRSILHANCFSSH